MEFGCDVALDISQAVNVNMINNAFPQYIQVPSITCAFNAVVRMNVADDVRSRVLRIGLCA
jgi:hypothetical protein